MPNEIRARLPNPMPIMCPGTGEYFASPAAQHPTIITPKVILRARYAVLTSVTIFPYFSKGDIMRNLLYPKISKALAL
jgi:hypothetical protein